MGINYYLALLFDYFPNKACTLKCDLYNAPHCPYKDSCEPISIEEEVIYI